MYLHICAFFHICILVFGVSTLSSASLSLLLLIALAPNIAQAWKSHFNRNYPKYHNKTQIWNILNFHIRWSRQIGTFLNLKGPRDHFKFDKVSKTCLIYGKGEVDKYEYHDPLQVGPKQCEPCKQFDFKSTYLNYFEQIHK